MEKPARKKSPVAPQRGNGSGQQAGAGLRGGGREEELYASVDRSKKAGKSADPKSNQRSASGDRLDPVGKPPRKRSPVAPGREKRLLGESDPALMGARAKEVQEAASEVPGPVGPQPVPSSRHKSERSKGIGDMDDMASQKFFATFHGSIDDGYRLDDPRGEADYDSLEFEKEAVAEDLAFDTLDSGIGTQNRGRQGYEFEHEHDTPETETEDYDATDSSGVKKSVSFSQRDQQFKLRPEPEIKTLPGTSMFSFAPSSTHKQPSPDPVAEEPYQVSAPPSVVAAASHRVPQRPQRDQSLEGEHAGLMQASTKHQHQEQKKLKKLAEQLHKQQQQQEQQQQQRAQPSLASLPTEPSRSAQATFQLQLQRQKEELLQQYKQQQPQRRQSLKLTLHSHTATHNSQEVNDFDALQQAQMCQPTPNPFSSLQYPPKRQQAANPMLGIPPAADPRRGASVDRVPKNVTYVNGEPVSTSPKSFFKAMLPKSREEI